MIASKSGLAAPLTAMMVLLVSMVAQNSSFCHGLSGPDPPLPSRRSVLETTAASLAGILAAASAGTTPACAAAGPGPGLDFQTSVSGVRWADARPGTGSPLKPGATATIDYSMSTTGARYGTKIYSTQQPATPVVGTSDKDLDATVGGPYRWTLGDGTTIGGIEEAILGDESGSVAPMKPGGIRRLVIPQSMAYSELANDPRTNCVGNGKPGPIPPSSTAFEEYQRFKNIYCNPSRQYQPDLVLDVKLYGTR